MDSRRLKSPTGTSLLPLEKKVYQNLKSLRPLLENKKLILGVSGGLDSVSLLYVMTALATRFEMKFHVLHVNHGVRGHDAENDSHFVRALTAKIKVSFGLKKLKLKKNSASENALRDLRYKALFSEMKKKKAAWVVVAHHHDDLLETRLIRLLQGTGLSGLLGMSIISENKILRPFLNIKRSELKLYAAQKGFDWCEDLTNKDTTKLRNWVRQKWLSLLRKDHPEYLESLALSLERLGRTHVEAKAPGHFSRKTTAEQDPDIDGAVYRFLRHHAKTRVTSRHVAEFRKRLQTARQKFSFRLAGREWHVSGASVAPR